MFNAGKNIRIINYDSIVIILILFFGILIYGNSNSGKSERKKDPVSISISAGKNPAISSSYIRLQAPQESFISDKDNFSFSATDRNQISENKITTLKIASLKTDRINYGKILLFIPGYHMYPSETDEPPHLS